MCLPKEFLPGNRPESGLKVVCKIEQAAKLVSGITYSKGSSNLIYSHHMRRLDLLNKFINLGTIL